MDEIILACETLARKLSNLKPDDLGWDEDLVRAMDYYGYIEFQSRVGGDWISPSKSGYTVSGGAWNLFKANTPIRLTESGRNWLAVERLRARKAAK